MAGFQYNPQPLNPQSFQFGMPSVTGGTLQSGYGAMPAAGVGSPWQPSYSLAPNAPTTNMGFQLPSGFGSAPASAYPGAPAGGVGGLSGSGFGFNMGTAQLGLDGLKTISGLYSAYQSNKLANESFEFSKRFAEKNLGNQTQSYNDRMADTLNARGFTTGRAQSETDSEIQRRKLSA